MTTKNTLHPVLEAKIVVPAASEPFVCDRVVACDWLSWSCPITNFKNIHKAGKLGIKVQDNPDFSPMPAPDYKSMTGDARATGLQVFLNQTTKTLMCRIRQFCTRVLGFECSANKGRGKNFYNDSFSLFTPDGLSAGSVNFGGNHDTVFFELTGVGCQYLFDNERRRLCDERYLTPFTLHFGCMMFLM